MEKFYMVWCADAETPPKMKYYDKESAVCQAKNLRAVNGWDDIYVLEVVDKITKAN